MGPYVKEYNLDVIISVGYVLLGPPVERLE